MKPSLLDERGGAHYSEAAIEMVAGLIGDTGTVQVANVRNKGIMPFLSDNAVIEVPSRISALGAVPLPIAPVSPLQAGLIAHVAAYGEPAVEASVQGGGGRVEDALPAHPLIGQTEYAQRLAADLVSVNRAYPSWVSS